MMHMRRAVLAIVLFGTALQAGAVVPFEERLNALKKGQPKDVVALINRISECDHWSGEEAFDAKRAKEMNAAMTRLRCDAVEKDEARMRKQNAHDPKVAAALDGLRRLLDE